MALVTRNGLSFRNSWSVMQNAAESKSESFWAAELDIFRQIALWAGRTACARTTQRKNDMAAPNDWSPSSWKSKPIVQDVVYEDQDHVDRVLNKLNRLPPMVSPQEVCVCSNKLWHLACLLTHWLL